MDIKIQPIVTEQATQLTERLNRYTFRVSLEANKYQIKDLVEKLYGVKVINVNTLVVRAKNKSRYTKSGLLRGK
ncbi:MAG: 50S ribosomal protein L23, partial [Muribaculaceae bacterium]|nr:50S ribosomal protein L23 [Muribaculaceae bacterium]